MRREGQSHGFHGGHGYLFSQPRETRTARITSLSSRGMRRERQSHGFHGGHGYLSSQPRKTRTARITLLSSRGMRREGQIRTAWEGLGWPYRPWLRERSYPRCSCVPRPKKEAVLSVLSAAEEKACPCCPCCPRPGKTCVRVVGVVRGPKRGVFVLTVLSAARVSASAVPRRHSAFTASGSAAQ
jgi:hypothetical protein